MYTFILDLEFDIAYCIHKIFEYTSFNQQFLTSSGNATMNCIFILSSDQWSFRLVTKFVGCIHNMRLNFPQSMSLTYLRLSTNKKNLVDLKKVFESTRSILFFAYKFIETLHTNNLLGWEKMVRSRFTFGMATVICIIIIIIAW